MTEIKEKFDPQFQQDSKYKNFNMGQFQKQILNIYQKKQFNNRQKIRNLYFCPKDFNKSIFNTKSENQKIKQGGSLKSTVCKYRNILGHFDDGPVLISLEKFQNLEYDEKIIDIQTGNNHILVLTSEGKVFSWGLNNFGQLGLEDRKQLKEINCPQQLKFDIKNFQHNFKGKQQNQENQQSRENHGQQNKENQLYVSKIYAKDNRFGQLGLKDKNFVHIPEEIQNFPIDSNDLEIFYDNLKYQTFFYTHQNLIEINQQNKDNSILFQSTQEDNQMKYMGIDNKNQKVIKILQFKIEEQNDIINCQNEQIEQLKQSLQEDEDTEITDKNSLQDNIMKELNTIIERLKKGYKQDSNEILQLEKEIHNTELEENEIKKDIDDIQQKLYDLQKQKEIFLQQISQLGIKNFE